MQECIRGFKSLSLRHLCSTKKLHNKKAQDFVGLVLFCYYILWFAHFAKYLYLTAAFQHFFQKRGFEPLIFQKTFSN